jgi:hypothetical protein
MPQESYPGKIKGEDDKAHYDVFARLNNIRDWPGYADQQEERRLWLKNWLQVNCDLSDDQLKKAKPVNVCELPSPAAGGKGADQEAAFLAEREAWWNHDDLKPGGKMDGFKQDNRDWLEARRKDVKGEHEGRFDKLSIATKHDPQWSDWKKGHDTTTGKKKPKESSWRDKSAKWLEDHNGITEDPSGSNCDNRSDGIRASQDKCANGTWLRNQPWCGVWVFRGLLAAGKVKEGDSWLASVASIEDYARAGKGPFRGWTTDGSKAKKGDVVVLFGRGQHTATVREITADYCRTWEGNTSSSNGGSQSNGGGAFKRDRSRNGDTYGYALVRD